MPLAGADPTSRILVTGASTDPGVLNQLSAANGRVAPRSVLLPLVNRAMDLF